MFITLIKANQLITEFKAGSSSLSEEKKIEDYNLIEYIKVIDFQTLNSNKDFNLKTTDWKIKKNLSRKKLIMNSLNILVKWSKPSNLQLEWIYYE